MTTGTPVSKPDSSLPECRAGIFKLARNDFAALREAASELGFACFFVDLSQAHNVPGFIKALRSGLNFPDWFGDNLDAVNDCLTDFSWQPAPGYVIAIDGFATLAASPSAFAAFNQVVASAVEEWRGRDIPFRVFYLIDGSSLARPSPVVYD